MHWADARDIAIVRVGAGAGFTEPKTGFGTEPNLGILSQYASLYTQAQFVLKMVISVYAYTTGILKYSHLYRACFLLVSSQFTCSFLA